MSSAKASSSLARACCSDEIAALRLLLLLPTVAVRVCNAWELALVSLVVVVSVWLIVAKLLSVAAISVVISWASASSSVIRAVFSERIAENQSAKPKSIASTQFVPS